MNVFIAQNRLSPPGAGRGGGVCLLLVALLAAFCALPSLAQMHMLHLDATQGLSSNRVFSIVEDDDHAMWIGTREGIDRFNGASVRSYVMPGRQALGSNGGLQHKLFFDSAHGLWAYDSNGRIARYDERADTFAMQRDLRVETDGVMVMNDLFVDSRGDRWIASQSGLLRWAADDVSHVVLENQYIGAIRSCFGTIVAGTNDGVWAIDGDGHGRQIASGFVVQTMFVEGDRLWVGTFQDGIVLVERRDGKFVQTPCPLATSKPVRAIAPLDATTLLVGVDGGGVFTFDCATRRTAPFVSTDESGPNYLHGNGIYAVTRDHQGNFWIGSYTGGVSCALMQAVPVTVFRHEHGNPATLSNNAVNAIEECADGSLWFSSDDGVSVRGREGDARGSHSWMHLLRGTSALGMCRSRDGGMWVGTYGEGVYRFDSKGRVAAHLTEASHSLGTNCAMAVREDAEGNLWVGGLDGRIMCYAPGGNLLWQTQESCVLCMATLDGGRMAVGTVDGVVVVDSHDWQVDKHLAANANAGASSYIVAMHYAGGDRLWLGTEGGGLYLYDIRTRETKIFTTADGLPSNEVYGILGGHDNRLWLSTGAGLTMYDGTAFSSLNYLGDVAMSYNKSSLCRRADGTLVFGSDNGAVAINPSGIAIGDYEARLHVAGYSLMPSPDRRITPFDADGLRLDYEQRSFAVHFEAINYHFTRDIVYQCMLDGYDKAWGAPSDEGRATFTNVPPGAYTLRIRCLRQSDGKVLDEQAVEVTLRQPWWNSTCAWTFYCIALLLVALLVWRLYHNWLLRQHWNEKMRFFINTAHDIRTPLTLVTAPLNDLAADKALDVNARFQVDMAQVGCRKLNSLVSELLDFEKLDSDSYRPQLTAMNMNTLVVEEAEEFMSLCEQKHLRLHVEMPDDTLRCRVDAHLVKSLLDNLLSNSCKYTPEGGDIWLTLRRGVRHAVLTVRDNGIGIPHETAKRVFREVVRGENVQGISGTGFGLIYCANIVRKLRGHIGLDSREGEGTTVTVSFRLTSDKPVAAPAGEPAVQTAAGEHQTMESAPVAPSAGETLPAAARGTYRVLLVEDSDELRTYLKRFFSADYNVTDVPDAQTALRHLETEYPDIIISDVMMPGIQGTELCRIVKERPDTSGIPVILLTAKTASRDVVEGLRSRADDYIAKPFNNDVLKAKVRSLLENRRLVRQFFMQAATQNALSEGGAEVAADTAAPQMPTDATIPQVSAADSEFVRKATDLVAAHMSDVDFSIDHLCREMAMSRTLFYNRLKSLTGKTPQEFIRELRLQRAARLLSEGRTVQDVTERTGFINSKYFSVVFKKHFGVQPSKYK
ncbi:MAG: response regulator [Bacteroidaceae bacterium]|nr:response regulator [Bacteroidaceae bacterium]